MATRIEHNAEFEHPVAVVLAEFTDEEALRIRLAEIGGHHAELTEHAKTATTVSYRMRQGVPAEKLPGAIRTIMPGDLMVSREQHWEKTDAGAICTAKVHVTGVPGSITARSLLSASGAGARMATTGEIKVSIPFIGAKLERTVAEQVVRLLRHEDEYVANRLAGA